VTPRGDNLGLDHTSLVSRSTARWAAFCRAEMRRYEGRGRGTEHISNRLNRPLFSCGRATGPRSYIVSNNQLQPTTSPISLHECLHNLNAKLSIGSPQRFVLHDSNASHSLVSCFTQPSTFQVAEYLFKVCNIDANPQYAPALADVWNYILKPFFEYVP
jgi:hypothetical protein